jgi:predicted O-methyltransferase YrrM
MTTKNLKLSFSNTWFLQSAKDIWEELIPSIKPKKILEIGVYEGASICFLIQKLGNDFPLEVCLIDTWKGGIEHKHSIDMKKVENVFKQNIQIVCEGVSNKVKLDVMKSKSDIALSKLLAGGKSEHYDFIYIDGSHFASDVLVDAVLAFKLLKVGGFMVFDDYLWSDNKAHN